MREDSKGARSQLRGTLKLQTARGAAWTIAFSSINKVFAFAAQLAIAFLLRPEEIGLVATATSIVGVASIAAGGQLLRVLVQRQASFNLEAPHAFWLSVCANAFLAVIILLASPLLCSWFHEPRLAPLLLILALALL